MRIHLHMDLWIIIIQRSMAYDTQLYISVPAASHVDAIERFVRCIEVT